MLRFPDDEVADEVAGIVWGDKRAVFVTETPVVPCQAVDSHRYSRLLI